VRALNYLIELPFVAVDNIRDGRDRRRQTDKEEGSAWRRARRRVDGEIHLLKDNGYIRNAL